MSNPSKSQNSAKSVSSRGSVCPPTARSPSIMTAASLTDPRKMPTALENSVNTARGATRSEMEQSSGFTDTSAGGSAPPSAPRTAKPATSPEILMNDLRRGDVFGRQSKGIMMTEDQNNNTSSISVTTARTSAPTTLSVKTGRSRLTSSGISSDANSKKKTSVTRKMKALKKKDRTSSVASGVSAKSGKTSKASGIQEMSGKSVKSMKSKKTSQKSQKSLKPLKPLETSGKVQKSSGIQEMSGKSMKSQKKTSTSSGGPSAKSQKTSQPKLQPKPFGTSGPVKLGDHQKVYSNQKSVKSRKGKPVEAYNWPGTGRCTRPPNDETQAAPIDSTVYDITQLTAEQRGLKRAPPLVGRNQLVGVPTVIHPPPSSVVNQSQSNKIVVLGETPDGLTQIQMTIDMEIIAGEALQGANGPVTLEPKKILIGGKEITVEGNKRT